MIYILVQNDIPSEFINLSKEIEPPGEMSKSTTYDFNFKKVELSFESYEGVNIAIRYKNYWFKVYDSCYIIKEILWHKEDYRTGLLCGEPDDEQHNYQSQS